MPRLDTRALKQKQADDAEFIDACSLILEAVRQRGKVNMLDAGADLILNLKLHFGIEITRQEAAEQVKRYFKQGPVYNTLLRDKRAARRIRVKQTE